MALFNERPLERLDAKLILACLDEPREDFGTLRVLPGGTWCPNQRINTNAHRCQSAYGLPPLRQAHPDRLESARVASFSGASLQASSRGSLIPRIWVSSPMPSAWFEKHPLAEFKTVTGGLACRSSPRQVTIRELHGHVLKSFTRTPEGPLSRVPL